MKRFFIILLVLLGIGLSITHRGIGIYLEPVLERTLSHLFAMEVTIDRLRVSPYPGRVWADLGGRPELDGTGIGLSVGLGGGLRLQWGETFVIRADAAHSPTEGSSGVYIDVNHIF